MYYYSAIFEFPSATNLSEHSIFLHQEPHYLSHLLALLTSTVSPSSKQPIGANAGVVSFSVYADSIFPTGVDPQFAFINICYPNRL